MREKMGLIKTAILNLLRAELSLIFMKVILDYNVLFRTFISKIVILSKFGP